MEVESLKRTTVTDNFQNEIKCNFTSVRFKLVFFLVWVTTSSPSVPVINCAITHRKPIWKELIKVMGTSLKKTVEINGISVRFFVVAVFLSEAKRRTKSKSRNKNDFFKEYKLIPNLRLSDNWMSHRHRPENTRILYFFRHNLSVLTFFYCHWEHHAFLLFIFAKTPFWI